MGSRTCLAYGGLIGGLLVALGGCHDRIPPVAEPPGRPLLFIESALRPLAKPLAPPQEGDWLAAHLETGQTFAEFARITPKTLLLPDATIYLLHLGDFSPQQQEILDITQEYLAAFFQAKVVVQGRLPLEVVPESARRVHPRWDTHQIHTGFILNELLLPERPADALAYLCFTASDLYSDATHNYVLGEARTWERVGVWSIYRNGDPAEGPDAWRICLRRTMHIATHETGHILAMKHCTAFECNMNGANSVSEIDRHPLHLCPVCLRKLLWRLRIDADEYLTAMQDFLKTSPVGEEAAWYTAAKQRLRSP